MLLHHTAHVLLRGLQAEVLSRDEALGYLNVGEDDLTEIVDEMSAA